MKNYKAKLNRRAGNDLIEDTSPHELTLKTIRNWYQEKAANDEVAVAMLCMEIFEDGTVTQTYQCIHPVHAEIFRGQLEDVVAVLEAHANSTPQLELFSINR